jgi:hypothetical protein
MKYSYKQGDIMGRHLENMEQISHMNDPRLDGLEKRVRQAVMKRIVRRRLMAARMWAAWHGLLIFAAAVAFVPALEYTLARSASSGFNYYMSLFALDGAHLAGSWSSLVLSLAESAPVLDGIFMLAALFVFAYSARKMAGDISLLHYSLS